LQGNPSWFEVGRYRNTIAGLPLGERIFTFFEKKSFASQKLNFSILYFSKKKSVKMTLNS
jgi:hypothetical protein